MKPATLVQMEKAESRKELDEAEMYHQTNNYQNPPANYFWQSLLVFPSLAVFCILLILFLSFIFFGRREGQHWRDYTTSKEQLQEYLNVRESQRHLREMSVQRQMLKMTSSVDRKSMTPLGINAFLQPKNPSLPPTPVPNPHAQNGQSRIPSQRSLISASQPRLPTSASPSPARHRLERRANSSVMDNGGGGPGNDPQEMRSNNHVHLTPRSSVGKQTVADAARATGSSLQLYRNPLDDDEDSYKEELLQSPATKYHEKSSTLR
uniref:Uncharacterized protein n=1 Tax=Ditylenchus dipsaci TaxID=166011 RepID=A0A915ETR5_9BILA